jgi:death-on-curing protein
MKHRWKFLTADDVLAIHDRLIPEFGGIPGVLHEGLLESAVAVAAAQFAGRFLHEDGPAVAAAYLLHICRGHPFLDGSKWTALAAAGVFLEVNAFRLRATQRKLEHITRGVAEGLVSKGEVTAFFRDHCALR